MNGLISALLGAQAKAFDRSFSDDIITVGANGKFATLQAALDYAVSQPMYVETVGSSGTLTFTEGTTEFTSTANIQQGPGINGFKDTSDRYVAVGTPRKFYPVKSIVSQSLGYLSAAFQEATITTASAQWWTARPIEQTIVLLDGIVGEAAHISADGTGDDAQQLPFIAIRIVNAAGSALSDHVSGSTITVNAASGYLTLQGFKRTDIHVNPKGGDTNPLVPDVNSIVKYNFIDVARESNSSYDFIYHGSTGGVSLRNCYIEGPYDVVIPHGRGCTEIFDSHLKATVKYQGDLSSIPRGCTTPFDSSNLEFRATNTVFEIGSTGATTVAVISAVFDAYCRDKALTNNVDTNNTFIFEKCTFRLDGSYGTTASANVVGFLLRCSNCDFYFYDCVFESVSEPAGHSFQGFAGNGSDTVPTKNRLHFIRSAPWNFPNGIGVRNVAEVITFEGSEGRAVDLTFGATLDTSELDLLRGDTYQLTLTGAVTSIPAVVNAPKGCRVRFLFTQDVTGGRAISGWAAAYKFHTAWSNTGNTSGTSSVVEFISDGAGNWIQTGAANSWL